MRVKNIYYPVWTLKTAAEVIAGVTPLQTLQYVHSHMITTGGAAT